MNIDLNKYLGNHSQGYVIKTLEMKDGAPFVNTLVKGYASVEPKKIKLEEEFLFDIASLTKFIMAMIIYKSVQDGLISLNSKITDIEPKFNKLDNITILDLLSHRQEIWTEGYLGNYQTKEEFQKIIYTAYVKTNDRKYVDVHYIILGMLLEKIYKKNLEEILKEQIVKPLNLMNTTYNPLTNKIVSNNYDYTTKFFGMDKGAILDFIYPGIPHDNKANIAKKTGLFLAHAGIFTTANDMLKILSCLIDGQELLLNKETINMMFKHDDINLLNMKRTSEKLTPFITYNYCGTRYKNNISQLNDIPKSSSENAITFSGYTGPIFLVDFTKRIIILVMSNVCHLSEMERHDRKDISVQIVEDIYEDITKVRK